MTQDIFLSGRTGFYATATYEDGIITVHAGSTLGYPASAIHRKTTKAYELREDPRYVKNGKVVRKCVFESPSTAAQFITGGSRNGYDCWKVKRGYSLGQFLIDKGLKEKR